MRKMSMRQMARVSNVEYQTIQRNVHLLLEMIGNDNLKKTIKELQN